MDEEPAQAVRPKQARSRHTLFRLLSAAEALLEHGGLEAATVPNIAKAAGVSVGVVYRRFPDKDALLRAVYEGYFATMSEQTVLRLRSVGDMELPLETTARALVAGLTHAYRRKRGLLRALRQYVQTHPDPEFRRHAQAMNRAIMHAVIALLLSHREKIKHPDPEMAIEFGMVAVASVLQNVILEEEPLHRMRLPANLEDELVRLFFSYLGITVKRKKS